MGARSIYPWKNKGEQAIIINVGLTHKRFLKLSNLKTNLILRWVTIWDLYILSFFSDRNIRQICQILPISLNYEKTQIPDSHFLPVIYSIPASLSGHPIKGASLPLICIVVSVWSHPKPLRRHIFIWWITLHQLNFFRLASGKNGMVNPSFFQCWITFASSFLVN